MVLEPPTDQNRAPEEIQSIDELLKEGWERVEAMAITKGAFGPLIPPAEAYFKRAVQLGISDPVKEHRAQYGLGTLLAAKWQKEAAIPHLQRAVQLQPHNYRSRLVLGKLYEDMGNHAHASSEFLAAARIANPVFCLYRALINYCKA